MARFTKTPLGREEITARKLALDRPTRNLLLIIDRAREGADWVRMVHGADDGALTALEQAGLIERVEAAPAAPAARPAPEEARRRTSAGSTLSDEDLYERLNALIKAQLGLVQGLRMTLAVEQAEGREALCAAARQVIDLVREQRGDAAASQVAWTLGFEG